MVPPRRRRASEADALILSQVASWLPLYVGACLAGALVNLAYVDAASLESALHPGVERVVGGLEGEHQHGLVAAAGPGGESLARVEEAAVGRIEAGLADGAHRLRALEEV